MSQLAAHARKKKSNIYGGFLFLIAFFAFSQAPNQVSLPLQSPRILLPLILLPLGKIVLAFHTAMVKDPQESPSSLSSSTHVVAGAPLQGCLHMASFYSSVLPKLLMKFILLQFNHVTLPDQSCLSSQLPPLFPPGVPTTWDIVVLYLFLPSS